MNGLLRKLFFAFTLFIGTVIIAELLYQSTLIMNLLSFFEKEYNRNILSIGITFFIIFFGIWDSYNDYRFLFKKNYHFLIYAFSLLFYYRCIGDYSLILVYGKYTFIDHIAILLIFYIIIIHAPLEKYKSKKKKIAAEKGANDDKKEVDDDEKGFIYEKPVDNTDDDSFRRNGFALTPNPEPRTQNLI